MGRAAARDGNYSFFEMCELLGRAPMFIRRTQSELTLYMPSKQEGYPEAYVNFLQKVVALRTFNVPLTDIADLFVKEKKILVLLHCDSISSSPTWYLDACRHPEHAENRLLLTGYDLGFPVTSRSVQSNLDFGPREAELFKGAEMGEDIHRILRLYIEFVAEICRKVEKEKPVLLNALAWSEHVFGDGSLLAQWALAMNLGRKGRDRPRRTDTPMPDDEG